MKNWSHMSRSHLGKLIYRGVIFISALVYYIVRLATGTKYGEENVLFVSFGEGVPVLLIIMAVVFLGEMVLRLFPTKHEAIGNQKVFKVNYIPTTNDAILKPRKQHWARTLLVFGSWTLLNLIIGGVHFFGKGKIISDDVMVLICLAYSVCDLICIMFFCPFQAWMMKNKCCTTCRIYNWDYPMIFTPFIFLILKPGPILHYVMLGGALIVWLLWEINYLRHAERFTENTNDRLSCKSCNEKLCRHNKFFPCKSALKKSTEDKNELNQNTEQPNNIAK